MQFIIKEGKKELIIVEDIESNNPSKMRMLSSVDSTQISRILNFCMSFVVHIITDVYAVNINHGSMTKKEAQKKLDRLIRDFKKGLNRQFEDHLAKRK